MNTKNLCIFSFLSDQVSEFCYEDDRRGFSQVVSDRGNLASISLLYLYVHGKCSNEPHFLVLSFLIYTCKIGPATDIVGTTLIPSVFQWENVSSSRAASFHERLLCLNRRSRGCFPDLFHIYTNKLCLFPLTL